MGFSYTSFLFPVLLLATSMQMTPACDNHLIQNCKYYQLIEGFQLKDFIPVDDFNGKCKDLKTALDCASDPAKIDGCSNEIVARINSVKNLQKAVCEAKRQEYLNSSVCLGAQEVKDSIAECFLDLEFAMDGKCETYQDCRENIRSAIFDLPSCGVKDKILGGGLVDSYLRPYIENEGCDFPVFEDEKTTTPAPTTTAAPETITVMVDAEVGAMTQRNATDTSAPVITTTTMTTTTGQGSRPRLTLSVLFLLRGLSLIL